MTVKEIAELAGVSIGTVDRVLHGRGRVSAETKAKIDGIVERSGFKPNTIARRLKRRCPYRFAALIPERQEDSGYWGLAMNGIRAAADELLVEGIETEIFEFDRYDPASFQAASAALLSRERDGVLLAPVMPREARRFIDGLGGMVPYAFFDADLPETDPVCSIGQDPYQGGYLAGRLSELFSGGGGLFAVVDAHSEDFHIRRRREGFCAYARERGFPVTVAENVNLEDSACAEGLLRELSAERPELAGVFVTSSSTHRVAQAAMPLRAARRFSLVGYDLVPENERLLRAGAIDAVISQRPETQGGRALLGLYRSIVLGRPVERREEVPLDLYIKENLTKERQSGEPPLNDRQQSATL